MGNGKSAELINSDTIKVKRDGTMTSPWQGLFPKDTVNDHLASNNQKYDAVVIGGGITGMTTAYLLQKAGKQCVLIEAHNVGFGTTGGTSAHINTFADTTYKEAESAFGKREPSCSQKPLMKVFQ